MEFQYDENRVHRIIYQLVWKPKRSKAFMEDVIAFRCAEIIRNTCKEKNWEIHELVVHKDHVRLCIQAWPSDSAADIVKELKWRTANTLRQEFSDLHKLPSLWTRQYFAATVGSVPSETLQEYISTH